MQNVPDLDGFLVEITLSSPKNNSERFISLILFPLSICMTCASVDSYF